MYIVLIVLFTALIVTLAVGYALTLFMKDTTPDEGCGVDCPWCPEEATEEEMYVDDVDDLEELQFLLSEAGNFLSANPGSEQAGWDVEDIKRRIDELSIASVQVETAEIVV